MIGQINIETTSFCNARCVICPHKSMNRREGYMSNELVKKILDDCNNQVPYIHYHLNGEPLLDSRLPDIIKYGRQKNPNSKHAIFTNGSLLGKRSDELLCDGGLLDEIYISFDGGDKETYEKHRVGLIFDDSLNSIRQFITKRNELNCKTVIHPLMVITKYNEHTTEQFSELWKGYLRLVNKNDTSSCISSCDSAIFAGQMNWAGAIENISNQQYPKFDRCPYLFNYHLFILYDGRVVMCCMDYDGKSIVGDANTENLHDISNGVKYNELRKLYDDKQWDKLPLCDKCVIRKS